jgi:hypothetical protein
MEDVGGPENGDNVVFKAICGADWKAKPPIAQPAQL